MSFEVQDDTPQSTVSMRRQQRARRRWASSVLVEIRDANEHHCARYHRDQLLFVTSVSLLRKERISRRSHK